MADLLGELADDGRKLIRAEVDLYKAIATHRIERASGGAVAMVIGALLLNAALIVLLVAAAFALARYIGPFPAGLIIAAIAAIVGTLLVRFGIAKMDALSGDAEEKAALEAGRNLA